jgi:hypothetical protein
MLRHRIYISVVYTGCRTALSHRVPDPTGDRVVPTWLLFPDRDRLRDESDRPRANHRSWIRPVRRLDSASVPRTRGVASPWKGERVAYTSRVGTHARAATTRSDLTRDARDDRPTSSRATHHSPLAGGTAPRLRHAGHWKEPPRPCAVFARIYVSVYRETDCRSRSRSTAFYLPPAFELMRRTHPGHSGCVSIHAARSSPPRSDGLKCHTAFRWNANDTLRLRLGHLRPALAFGPPTGVRRVYHPQSRWFRSEENVRIPPLRSAVRRNLMLALVVR